MVLDDTNSHEMCEGKTVLLIMDNKLMYIREKNECRAYEFTKERESEKKTTTTREEVLNFRTFNIYIC